VESFVIISGCSGGGKSTLLAELGRRGYAVVEEPGRRIVRQEVRGRRSGAPMGGQLGQIVYDRSKPGNRRWCSSALSGNRDKTRNYRARKQQAM